MRVQCFKSITVKEIGCVKALDSDHDQECFLCKAYFILPTFLMPAEPTEGVHLERCNAFMWFILMLLLICLSLEG